jgi:acyl-CoA reductase-like NAD-dependent aldehyde dehydrogenase
VSEFRGAVAPISATSRDATIDESELDQAVRDVADKALSWSRTTPKERAALLARVVNDTFAVSQEWSAAGCAAKGYDPQSTEGGEELFSGVGTFVRLAQTLRQSLLDIDRVGRPVYPGPVRHKSGGRVAVQVAPATLFDKILYGGVTGEVWMEPGVDEDDVKATQGLAYKSPDEHVGVSLVLGAGNVASLGPRDVLGKLFVEGKVVVLKANPVNDYLVPYWRRAMASLIEAGYLRVVSGGTAAGVFLTDHELISDVHITGSDKTFDAIVFGVGDEGAARKKRNEPRLSKPVSGELGNVSPVVIVPGHWTPAEIDFQARHVATMITNNAGFNCLTPRVIITHEAWAQRGEFMEALSSVLASLPTRRDYYPGARERRATFVESHPEASELGAATDDTAPWTLLRDVDANNVGDVAFNVEAFCALTAETALDASSPADFVRRATEFCNDVVWGSLSMTLICDPRTMKDAETGAAIDEAIANLRYGSIGVNLWHALSFALGTTVWGAYPGHAVNDIQSGQGFVGNAYMFSRPQKSVVRGPFVARPAPAWFATNKNGADVMARLLDFEVKPSWMKLPGLFRAALKG